MELEEKYKSKIISLLTALFPDCKIYLYGSRARGDHYPTSDIDIALDRGEKIPFVALGEARQILEGAYIPYKIDLVDINSVSSDMRKLIKQDMKIWKS